MGGSAMSGSGGNRALELLRSLPRVSLANLRPSPGSKKRVSACGLQGGPWRRDRGPAARGLVCPRGCQGHYPGTGRRAAWPE